MGNVFSARRNAAGESNSFPVIKTGLVPEFYVDGVHRIDDVGSVVHIYYFQFAKDPSLNNGMVYRLPVLKQVRAKDTLAAAAGIVKDFMTNGTMPGLVLPPSLGGKIY